MRRTFSSILMTLALVSLVATGVTAQSVSDIVDEMYAAYERQAAGVDNYTLVQTVMGFESTSYFEKEMSNGRPVFRMRGGSAQGGNFNFGLGSDDSGMGDVYSIGPELIEHGRYAGREEIDGSSVHVIAIDDLSQVSLGQQTTPDDMEFEPKTGRLYVDTEMMIPRRMEFVGDATTPDGVNEVTVSINLQDIRNVQGLLIPYSTLMEISGLQAMIDPEMQAQLREMEQQLDALPAEQRQMMERMLGAQLEQLRQMASGGGDAMSVQVTVNDVRVNSGPPGQ
ncbi:MAG: hypothetical protein OEN00_04360 [Gemmatimonadota bacterium]|nr:hypothetical protein [Gemmatimonadota bacterium]